MIEIDKNIPMPERRKAGRQRRYPFHTMKVGDSFLYKDHLDDSILACRRISAMAGNYVKKCGGKFSCRTQKNGIRVFKVE